MKRLGRISMRPYGCGLYGAAERLPGFGVSPQFPSSFFPQDWGTEGVEGGFHLNRHPSQVSNLTLLRRRVSLLSTRPTIVRCTHGACRGPKALCASSIPQDWGPGRWPMQTWGRCSGTLPRVWGCPPTSFPLPPRMGDSRGVDRSMRPGKHGQWEPRRSTRPHVRTVNPFVAPNAICYSGSWNA